MPGWPVAMSMGCDRKSLAKHRGPSSLSAKCIVARLSSQASSGAGALADANRKDEARQLLDIADNGILESNMPYAMPSRSNQHNYFTFRFLEAAYKAGHTALADKVSKALHKDFDQQLKYYSQLPDRKQESMRMEIAGAQQLLQMLQMLENNYKSGSGLTPSIESGGVISQPQDSSQE